MSFRGAYYRILLVIKFYWCTEKSLLTKIVLAVIWKLIFL